MATRKLEVSSAGLSLIQKLEGFRAEPLRLADGRAVIGYGHVSAEAPSGRISEEDASKILRTDLQDAEAVVNEKVFAPLTQSQFDALVSFAHSIGADNFARSDVLRRLNAGEPIAAACAMDAWRKSAVHGEAEVLDQLVRRRTLEKAHFLDVAAPVGAPSAIVQPVIDHAAAILGAPVKMTTLAQLESALNAANDAETPAAANANDSDEPLRLAAILAAQARTAETLKPPVEAEDVAPDEADSASIVREEADTDGVTKTADPATPFKRPQLQVSAPTPEKQAENTVSGLALLGLVGAGALSIGIAGLATEGQSGAAQFYIFGSIGASMCLMAAYYLLKQFAGGSLRRMLNPTKTA